MCFPKCKQCEQEIKSYYDEEDGSVVQENNNSTELVIPENIHEHIDSVYLNFEIQSPDCILAFIYEADNEMKFIIWTSDEAFQMCNEPFIDLF